MDFFIYKNMGKFKEKEKMILDTLISVIIPVYNVEKYLKECIESVLEQTYSNLEILLIDDGSTDKSLEICESYANIDERIVVIHQINKGLSSARNIGIENACGEYLVFVDSDDCINKMMIEKLYIALKKIMQIYPFVILNIYMRMVVKILKIQ